LTKNKWEMEWKWFKKTYRLANIKMANIQKNMEAVIRSSQDKTETTTNSIQSKPEETLTSQVEDILSCVNQRTHGLWGTECEDWWNTAGVTRISQ
jgi:hypothetical protein